MIYVLDKSSFMCRKIKIVEMLGKMIKMGFVAGHLQKGREVEGKTVNGCRSNISLCVVKTPSTARGRIERPHLQNE